MTLELTIPGVLAGARCAQALLEELLQTFGYAAHNIFAIKLALEESLVNAIKYGTRMDPDKRIQIRYTVTDERCDVRVTAEGEEFGPTAL